MYFRGVSTVPGKTTSPVLNSHTSSLVLAMAILTQLQPPQHHRAASSQTGEPQGQLPSPDEVRSQGSSAAL